MIIKFYPVGMQNAACMNNMCVLLQPQSSSHNLYFLGIDYTDFYRFTSKFVPYRRVSANTTLVRSVLEPDQYGNINTILTPVTDLKGTVCDPSVRPVNLDHVMSMLRHFYVKSLPYWIIEWRTNRKSYMDIMQQISDILSINSLKDKTEVMQILDKMALPSLTAAMDALQKPIIEFAQYIQTHDKDTVTNWLNKITPDKSSVANLSSIYNIILTVSIVTQLQLVRQACDNVDSTTSLDDSDSDKSNEKSAIVNDLEFYNSPVLSATIKSAKDRSLKLSVHAAEQADVIKAIRATAHKPNSVPVLYFVPMRFSAERYSNISFKFVVAESLLTTYILGSDIDGRLLTPYPDYKTFSEMFSSSRVASSGKTSELQDIRSLALSDSVIEKLLFREAQAGRLIGWPVTYTSLAYKSNDPTSYSSAIAYTSRPYQVAGLTYPINTYLIYSPNAADMILRSSLRGYLNPEGDAVSVPCVLAIGSKDQLDIIIRIQILDPEKIAITARMAAAIQDALSEINGAAKTVATSAFSSIARQFLAIKDDITTLLSRRDSSSPSDTTILSIPGLQDDVEVVADQIARLVEKTNGIKADLLSHNDDTILDKWIAMSDTDAKNVITMTIAPTSYFDSIDITTGGTNNDK